MSHRKEKNGRLSFETQLKIKFLPLKNSSKKMLARIATLTQLSPIHKKEL